MFANSNLIGVLAKTTEGMPDTVYVIVVPVTDKVPAPIPLLSISIGDRTNPFGNATVTVFMMPVVVVVNNIS